MDDEGRRYVAPTTAQQNTAFPPGGLVTSPMTGADQTMLPATTRHVEADFLAATMVRPSSKRLDSMSDGSGGKRAKGAADRPEQTRKPSPIDPIEYRHLQRDLKRLEKRVRDLETILAIGVTPRVSVADINQAQVKLLREALDQTDALSADAGSFGIKPPS